MRKFIVASALLASSSVSAWAGSILVSPVHVRLSSDNPTAVVKVTNQNKTPTVMQMSEFVWSQTANGKRVLKPTRSLLATPPIFTLPAGGTQVVRVGLRVKPNASRETSYRLLLAEVPPKPAPGAVSLQIALRFSIPVFVAPSHGVAMPKLAWSASRIADNKVTVTVKNTGNAHARLMQLSLGTSDKGPSLAKIDPGLGYILPGTTLSWTVKLSSSLKPGQDLMVRGKTAKRTFHENLGLVSN